MANPAATFCAMGGRSVAAKLPDGAPLGPCELPGRKVVEDWTRFRMLDGKVSPPDASPFR